MASANRVLLMGKLTRDPQVRRTPSGTAVADLNVAIPERFFGPKGEPVERTCLVDIVAWDRQAEFCEQQLKKGVAVLIEGSLVTEQWETEDGQRRSRLKVRADRIEVLRPEPSAPGETGPASRRRSTDAKTPPASAPGEPAE